MPQHKIEALPAVERCFVHVDYQCREADDHSRETPVTHKIHSDHTRCSDGLPPTMRRLSTLSADFPDAPSPTSSLLAGFN